MTPEMSPADRAQWSTARTVEDVGRVTAQWLLGHVSSQPGYAVDCGPDYETGPLVPLLAAVNCAGFATVVSQPGIPKGPGYDHAIWEQRAAVSGFATWETTTEILDALPGDLITIIGTGDPHPTMTPVTTWNGQPCTWFGPYPTCDIRHRYAVLHRKARRALRHAHRLVIVDPVWGRQDDSPLWAALEQFAATANR